jgi:hypothetical protein
MAFETYFLSIVARAIELLTSPARNPDMIWMVAPLAVSVIFMTIYFGKYETEELGWNTAFGNSLVLMFVSIDLLRQIYNEHAATFTLASLSNFTDLPIRSTIAFVLLAAAFIMIVLNFKHAVPEELSFFISSALPINLTAYVAMTIVYTNVEFDPMTLWAALTLFVILLALLQIVKLIERAYLTLTTGGEVTILPGTKRRQEESERRKELDTMIDEEMIKEMKKTGKTELTREEKDEVKQRVLNKVK